MSLLHSCVILFFFLMIRRPPRSTLDRSSAASDVYKRQEYEAAWALGAANGVNDLEALQYVNMLCNEEGIDPLSLIHISEPTRPY